MSLKKAAIIAGAVGGLMMLAPVANAQTHTQDNGQNTQNCGNIDNSDNTGSFEPEHSPNFVKCNQIVTLDNYPKIDIDPPAPH